MPQTKEIQIFMIGETNANEEQINQWMKYHDVKADWPCTEHKVTPDLTMPRTCAETVIGLAAKRCYLSFKKGLNANITRVRDDWKAFFENILSSGHGSVLEHATYTFAIEGCTRVFTAEMNRHRAGVAISEGSLRYVRCDNLSYWEPQSIKPLQKVTTKDQEKLQYQKCVTREIFDKTFAYVEMQYARLLQLWDVDNLPFEEKKKLTSMFRRIVPMGVSTGGVWTFNVRALRHILELRMSKHAEEEIQLVCSTMAKMIFEREPNLFGDFKQLENGALGFRSRRKYSLWKEYYKNLKHSKTLHLKLLHFQHVREQK